ncbi:efflux RND transporter periplasmic adaptor subunit [Rhodospirillaceae bacterium SYSU D60014]|uniref:efflux RND transporter periplasmic adaptor subunit n=1 Tax=Virgifigura deserti TaxID=2268457 RepID=UPI000E660948
MTRRWFQSARWRTRSRGAAIIAPFAAFLLAACDGGDSGGEPSQTQSQPVPVGIIEVQPEPVAVAETFVGRLEAIQNVEIRARISGVIEERLFDAGETVRQGQSLFRIERQVYEAVVEQRRADLAAAQAEQENANAQLRRAQELVGRGNIPEATVDERQAAARSAEAAVLQAQAALRQAEIDLGYTNINAPVAGRIGRANFDVGDLVGPESSALTEIVNQDPIYALFSVSQRVLAEVRQNAGPTGPEPSDFVVRLHLVDGTLYPHPGRIDFVATSVDRGTDTVQVRAVVPNPKHILRDGQFVQVVVEEAEPELAIALRQSAVLADQQGNFVMAVTPEDRVEIRRVELGETLDRGRVVVQSGLEDGDRVIVQGIQRVQPGAPVAPRAADEPTAGQTTGL